MKILKCIIYTLLGLLLAGAVGLVGIILYAEYSGRRFNPNEIAAMADADFADEESRLVYDENGNLAELPIAAPAASSEDTDASAGTAKTVPAAAPASDTADSTPAESAASDGTTASPAASTDAAAGNSSAGTASVGASDNIERDYVMDMASNLFHTADCLYTENIAAENRSDMTTTRDKIINAGYEPCSNCNP